LAFKAIIDKNQALGEIHISTIIIVIQEKMFNSTNPEKVQTQT